MRRQMLREKRQAPAENIRRVGGRSCGRAWTIPWLAGVIVVKR
jgi:hypothetical protein